MGLSRCVSIAVCTRNRSRTLPDTLRSLIDQSYPSDAYEIVVVDDGSTDATGETVEHIISETSQPLIRYIRQEHAGLSNARNRAIVETTGDLISFVDDDAIASEGWLSAVVDGARRHPDVDCFAGRIILRLEAKAPKTCGRESLAAELDEGTDEHQVRYAKGANMTVRRSAFKRVGLFNPSLVWRGDEVDWQRRLQEAGGRVIYLPNALVWHRRLEVDLKWGRIVRTKYAAGKGQVQYRREAGLEVSYRHEIKTIVFALLHTIRRRCPGGVLRAANHLGVITSSLRGELDKPRTVAPTYPEDTEQV